MAVPVMMARKKFNVQYPNLYATPGFHKNADAFNRVQRGHQNMYESLTTVTVLTLTGGLSYPLLSTASFATFLLGSHLYAVGYANVDLDVKVARYKRGGGIKWLGIFALMFTSISTAGQMQGYL